MLVLEKITFVLYCSAWISSLLFLYRGSVVFEQGMKFTAMPAFFLQAILLLWKIILFKNLSFPMVVFAVGWIVAGLWIFSWRKKALPALGSVLLPFPVLFILLAWKIETRLPQQELDMWQILHVVLAVGGYAFFTKAFGFGLAYEIQDRRLKNHRLAAWNLEMPSLEALESEVLRSLRWGLGMWLGAMVFGGFSWLMTHQSQVPHSGVKMFSSLVVAAIYVIFFLLRCWRKPGSRKTVFWTVVGYTLAMVCFLGLYWLGW